MSQPLHLLARSFGRLQARVAFSDSRQEAQKGVFCIKSAFNWLEESNLANLKASSNSKAQQ